MFGALKHGHFVLTSGKHSDTYFEKFDLFRDPTKISILCKHFDFDVDIVVGPATGGMILAFETARQLGVSAAYIEKSGSIFKFGRGQTFKPGSKILIVDDVLTTGSSIRKIIQAIQEFPVEIVQIAVIVDRSDGVDFGIPLYSVIKQKTNIWEPENCPICRIEEGK